jgi:hypothetical protein
MMIQFMSFILQYHVWDSKNNIMISLLTNLKVRKYDILTRQKSWRNVCVSTSYNLFTTNFHLTYDSENNVRISFYINVKLNVDRWSINFISLNICTIKLKITRNNAQRNIHIHNVYNAFLISYSFHTHFSSQLSFSRQWNVLLQKNAKHILLNDFNLHYSF